MFIARSPPPSFTHCVLTKETVTRILHKNSVLVSTLLYSSSSSPCQSIAYLNNELNREYKQGTQHVTIIVLTETETTESERIESYSQVSQWVPSICWVHLLMLSIPSVILIFIGVLLEVCVCFLLSLIGVVGRDWMNVSKALKCRCVSREL